MANQPKKKKFDYEKSFSNEIKNLFAYITGTLSETVPFTSITFDVFLIAGLEYHDSMLYKMLNNYMTGESIDEIHDAVFELVSDKNISPVRPNRIVEFSPEMKNLFTASFDLMKEIDTKTITSDMVFVSFMRSADNSNPIKKLFLSEGIDEETALNLSKKVKDLVSTLIEMSDDDIKKLSANYSVNADFGDGNDYSIISVSIVDPSDIASKENLAKLLSKPQGTTPVKTKKNPSIEFCESLNAKAETGQIEEVIGRDNEILDIARVLGRKNGNNVVLVGEPGVGKTAIVNGLAKRIVDGNCPTFFKGSVIWSLNMNSLIGGTQFRGQFESRINSLISGLKSTKKPILFIDNIHNYASDRNKSEFDLFGALDPVFDDKGIQVIVATTKKGYHSSFETTQETARKFQKVYIDEPSESECREIVEGAAIDYERFHKVKYDKEAIDACIDMASRYISERKLPSSALDILDEAGSICKLSSLEPDGLSIKRNRIAELEKEKDKNIKEDNVSSLRDIDYEISGLKQMIDELLKKSEKENKANVVGIEDICEAVSKITGVPVSKLNVSEKKHLSKISSILKESIIGQDEAVDIVSRGIKRSKIGLSKPNRPILSALFIGNTGCGKTLFAKTLAREIFGSDSSLIRFDMSEYSDETAVNKLIGASAGYVGYNEGGLLTEAVKNKKHCVVLIDEIEKATDKIFNVFLQVLDEGFLTDNTGYKVDFKNTILIMTSNIGTKRASSEKQVGFEIDKNANKRDIIEKELKNRFSPEFLNRLDNIVYFNSLSDENLMDITALEMKKLAKCLKDNGYDITYNDEVIKFLFDKIGNEKEYGARPIRRIISEEVENKITDIIIDGDEHKNSFNVFIENNELKIS